MPLFLGVAAGTLEGAPWQIDMYWRRSVDTDPTGALNIWSATMGSLFGQVPPGTPLYLNVMSSRDRQSGLWVYRIDESTDKKVAKYEASAGFGAGQDNGGAHIIAACVLVLLRSNMANTGTGKLYLPRPTVTSTFSGFLNSGVQANVKSWVGSAFAFLAANQSTPVIRNRQTHTDQAVTQWVVSNHLAVQRGRAKTGSQTYV